MKITNAENKRKKPITTKYFNRKIDYQKNREAQICNHQASKRSPNSAMAAAPVARESTRRPGRPAKIRADKPITRPSSSYKQKKEEKIIITASSRQLDPELKKEKEKGYPDLEMQIRSL